MRNLNFIYMGFVFLTMAACSEIASDDSVRSGNIQLCATVGDLQIDGRSGASAAPFLPGAPLEADVWFRNDNGGYENNPDGETNLPVHTTVTFEGSKLTYVKYDNKDLKYPSDKSKVCCIGLYPKSDPTKSEWKTTDNKIVSHRINGEEDLMFAQEMKGSWDQKFPPQEYKHLLTWIKIDICASSHEAIDAWGTIKQISVTSDSEVKVNLIDGTWQYESPKPIDTMKDEDVDVFLSTSIYEIGSVFCSPELEYKVTVVTKNKGGVEESRTISLKLNLIDVENNDKVTELEKESDAMGKCFVFSLYFTPYDVIEGTCTLNSWSNQNEDIYVE